MEPGFIADRTYGENRQEKWSAGEPQQLWGGELGVKVDRHELVPVTTLRCPNCGALESYANPT
jgi:hypothetical protein